MVLIGHSSDCGQNLGAMSLKTRRIFAVKMFSVGTGSWCSFRVASISLMTVIKFSIWLLAAATFVVVVQVIRQSGWACPVPLTIQNARRSNQQPPKEQL